MAWTQIETCFVARRCYFACLITYSILSQIVCVFIVSVRFLLFWIALNQLLTIRQETLFYERLPPIATQPTEKN